MSMHAICCVTESKAPMFVMLSHGYEKSVRKVLGHRVQRVWAQYAMSRSSERWCSTGLTTGPRIPCVMCLVALCKEHTCNVVKILRACEVQGADNTPQSERQTYSKACWNQVAANRRRQNYFHWFAFLCTCFCVEEINEAAKLKTEKLAFSQNQDGNARLHHSGGFVAWKAQPFHDLRNFWHLGWYNFLECFYVVFTEDTSERQKKL